LHKRIKFSPEGLSFLGPHFLKNIRRRLRCVYWRRWKRGKKRFVELRKLDIRKELAARAAGSIHGPWRLNRSPALSYAFPNAHFDSLGLAVLTEQRNA